MAMSAKMPIGKYKNMSLAKVLWRDKQYLKWFYYNYDGYPRIKLWIEKNIFNIDLSDIDIHSKDKYNKR